MKYLNEVWAVIPARSGSKGLKNKNIKKFKNKPLFSHSVRSAINSNQIDKVIFSSDSKKYISLLVRFLTDSPRAVGKILYISNCSS